jgi:threonine dehydrogenase-like Zn-dependent dehydrogenase
MVRIDSVGICGSDMHAYLGHDERRPAPLDPRPRGALPGRVASLFTSGWATRLQASISGA